MLNAFKLFISTLNRQPSKLVWENFHQQLSEQKLRNLISIESSMEQLKQLKQLQKLNEQCKKQLQEECLNVDNYEDIKKKLKKIESETSDFIYKAQMIYASSNKIIQLNTKLTVHTQELRRLIQEIEVLCRPSPPQSWSMWTLKLIPRLAKGIFDLVQGTIKGVIYLISGGYLNYFKKDQIQLKKRQLKKKQTQLKDLVNECKTLKTCTQYMKGQLLKFVQQKMPEYIEFMNQLKQGIY